jgi:hypothetical protein
MSNLVAQTQQDVVTAKANQSFNDFVNDFGKAAQVIESATSLKDETAAPFNMARQYFEAEQGKTYRHRFLGIIPDYQSVNQETGETFVMPAAVICDEKKDIYVYAATQFVATITDLNLPIGQGVEWFWDKNKKTGNSRFMRVHNIKPLM